MCETIGCTKQDINVEFGDTPAAESGDKAVDTVGEFQAFMPVTTSFWKVPLHRIPRQILTAVPHTTLILLGS